MLKGLLTNKKSSNKTNKNKLFDLNINAIENDIVISADRKYKMILRVSPINGELLNEDTLEQITQAIQGSLSSFGERKGIYILSERVDISENIRNIETIKNINIEGYRHNKFKNKLHKIII